MEKKMVVTTPEILWHGGGLECGKPDPVLSVDLYGNQVLATSGIDANVPPKGSVRLWRVSKSDAELEFLVDLSDHQSVVNAVRFSPCGRMIASASDRQIVIYYVPDPRMWSEVTDPKMVERIWLRPCLQEIYDLEWSPDSVYIIAGSIDSKGEILRATGRDSLLLRGHTSYVQGVAWDPMNQMVVTQSADRSCRVFQLKHRGAGMVKLAPKGHSLIRMTGGPTQPAGSSVEDANFSSSTSAPPSTTPPEKVDGECVVEGVPGKEDPQLSPVAKPLNLFADSTVPCFFRRPAFSPDGSLLVVPTGVCRVSPSPPLAAPAADSASFATHIFHRGDLQSPAVSLVGLEDPSVAVRFSPVLYQADGAQEDGLFEGKYRMMFAVMTTSAVLLYDTQHSHPLAYIGGCHLASINDAAWSADGNTLIFCSSDGYVSFARFPDNALGTPLSGEEVPEEVKLAFRSVYLPPVVDTPKSSGTDATEVADIPAAPAAPSSAAATSSLLAMAVAGSVMEDGADKKRVAVNEVQSPSLPCNDTDSAQTGMPNSLSSGSCSTVQNGEDSESAPKKKRRITPVMVSPLRPSAASTLVVVDGGRASSSNSTTGVSTSLTDAIDQHSTTAVEPPESSSSHCGAVGEKTDVASAAVEPVKKIKKRIAPMHVGDAIVSLPQLP